MREKTSRLPCLSHGLGNDRRGTSGSRDVTLMIFIAFVVSVSGSKSTCIVIHCFCEWQRKLNISFTLTACSSSVDYNALSWHLMWPKEIENLATFSVREVKRAAAEERDRDNYSFCRRTVRVKAKSKVIPTSFQKVEEGHLLG